MAARYLVGGIMNSTASWSESSGGAGGASIPTAADDAIVDGNSPSCTVGTARSFLTLNFTGYTNTITMDADITVAGNVTLGSGMTIVDGVGILILNATLTVTSNGKSWTGKLRFTNASSRVYTITGDLSATTVTFAANAGTTYNGNKVKVQGNCEIQNTTTLIEGTSEIVYEGTGTITSSLTTGSIRNNVTFAAGSNYSIVGNWNYGTGLLKREAGATLTVSAATLDIRASCSIGMHGANGFSWPNVNLSSTATITLVSELTFGVTTIANVSVTHTGAKLTINGNVSHSATANTFTTDNLEFVGPLTYTASSVTTGGLRGNVTFRSGIVTIAGTLSHGSGNLTKHADCTLVASSANLILQVAASVADLGGTVFQNVTATQNAFTHTLTTNVGCEGVLSVGSGSQVGTINGAEITFSGTSITSALTSGRVLGTTVVRITSTCSIGSASLTTGLIALPVIIDAPGKIITLTPSWNIDVCKWRVIAGTIVNAAGQQWLTTPATFPRAGRVINQSIQPGSNPRLFFRAYDGMVPLTTLNAAGISAASYRRQVDNVWGSLVSVGALTDGTEFQAYSVGRVIKHSCAIGNLYSIDVPVAATAEGAEAIRLSLTLVSGTASVDVVEHNLAAARDTVTELRKIPRATAAVTAGGSVRRSIGNRHIDETITGDTPV
jgi:hypothetical protein